MIDPTTFGLYVVTVTALVVTPGPAVLYVVARSLDQGRWAGIVSSLGIGAGTLVHIVAALLGLTALLRTSVVAVDVVRWIGAAFLVYIGLRQLRDGPPEPNAEPRRAPLRRLFTEGVVVNALNPKNAMFVLAFLPQFVDVERGAVELQILLLGATLIAVGLLSDSVYALLAGSVGGWLRGRPSLLRAQHAVTGGVLVALGLGAALAGAGRK